MTSRICKYGCGVLLEGFDEVNRKYIEAGTGGLHTKERCQEAKAKLEQKDDHGNESYSPEVKQKVAALNTELVGGYVDHTIGRPSKVKIFFSNHAPELEKEYEEFQIGKKFAWSRAHSHVTPEGDSMLFTIYFWYEEIAK